MGSLENDRKYGVLLFALDHHAGVGSPLPHQCQGERRILDFAGDHFQRFRYIAKRGCYAVSWNFPYIPASGTDLEC
jgi:hypothetical protein